MQVGINHMYGVGNSFNLKCLHRKVERTKYMQIKNITFLANHAHYNDMQILLKIKDF